MKWKLINVLNWIKIILDELFQHSWRRAIYIIHDKALGVWSLCMVSATINFRQPGVRVIDAVGCVMVSLDQEPFKTIQETGKRH